MKPSSGDRIFLDKNEVPNFADSRYAGPAKQEALKNALATALQTDPGFIVPTAGSSESIERFLDVLGRSGPMVIGDTTFPLFYRRAQIAEVKTVALPHTATGAFDLERILSATRRRTRGKILPFPVIVEPNNPTGAGVGRAALLYFLMQLDKKIPVVIDRAYAPFSTDTASVPEILNAHAKTIILETSSKAYAGAGLRAGAIIVPDKKLRDRFTQLVLPENIADHSLRVYTKRVISPTFLKNRVEANLRNRKFFARQGWDAYPSQGNFVAVRVKDDPQHVVEALAARKIDIRAGSEYGPAMQGRVRVTYGTPAQNRIVAEALAPYVVTAEF